MKTFKFLFLITYFLTILLHANEIDTGISFTKKELAFIKKHPQIKFSDVSWKPFFEINNNQNSGIFKEYYKLIEERTGLKFEFVQIGDGINFQLVLDALKNKEIDMIDGTGKTISREKYALFSDPLMKVSLAIVSNKIKKYQSLSELKNKKIVVARGSTASEYVQEFFPNKELIYTNGIREAISLVDSRKADALIDNIVVLDHLIKENSFKKVQISGILNYDFTIYSLIRNDYEILQSILNKAINSITKDELHKINNKLILSTIRPHKNKILFTDEEYKYINNKVFKIGVLSSAYPFSFYEDNNIKGLSFDLINLLIKKSNLKIEYVVDSWSKNAERFKNGELDLIDSISYNTKRSKYTNFSKSYYEIPHVIFTRKDEFNNYKSIESLVGKKIGISKDIYYYDDLEKLGIFELIRFGNTKEKMKALSLGKVDAIFNNLVSGQKHIKLIGYKNLKILDEIPSSLVKREDLRIGIRKSDQLLHSIINKSFEAITFEEKRNLLIKWFSSENIKRFNKINYTKEESEYFKKKKSLSLCVDPNWMPFDKLEKNVQIGMNSEFIKIIQSNINIPIKILPSSTFREALSYAKNGKCDFLSLIAKTENRNNYLNFTKSYLDVTLVLVTQLTEASIYDIKSLKNKTIAVQRDSSLVDLIRNNYPHLKLLEVENNEEGLEKVKENKVYALAGSLVSIGYHFQKGEHNQLKISGTFNEKLKLGFAVNKNDEVLFSIMKKLVFSISEEDKQRIMNKWFSINYGRSFDYELFWKVMIVACLIILFFIYRHYEIKRSNKQLHESVKEEVNRSRDKDKLLFHQNKMVSMGQMIENIAHQWRQPLSQINSSILIIDDILYEKKIKDKVLLEKLNEIESMTQYMSDTINDFREFTSPDKRRVNFDICMVVERSINIIKASFLFNKIEIDFYKNSDIIFYNGYPNELQQVLLVMLNNAKDVLLMRNIKDPEVTIRIVENDKSYQVFIKDNGGGIDSEVLDKIFEPYFTTKHPSKGTGLGLYLSKKIIEEGMGGSIYVQNDTVGANFVITLKKESNG
ncbi:transporter substrate-binding domain-containing protein [Poseidonibacter lekithochrous]|uniref:transporter substrate-binding domain-containing protein n=1 Tax=Poseidonibacter lekithochrous TaxID=1904463 RepID=UPI0008FC52EA|nr:transporter substrate-binding domain-containing protein [Poseidonibacter lekithochrous]QKJ21813.1 BvgS-like domain-containing two-component system sensor histidine kinase [Poseidonibacter lekithochrous]